MATVTGSMSELLDKISKTDDPKSIFDLSREIKKGSRSVTIKLDDPNADYYPFIFKKGEKVVSTTGVTTDVESKGTIIEGIYEGTERPGGSYVLIYTIQRDKDGLLYKARDLDLSRIGEPTERPPEKNK